MSARASQPLAEDLLEHPGAPLPAPPLVEGFDEERLTLRGLRYRLRCSHPEIESWAARVGARVQYCADLASEEDRLLATVTIREARCILAAAEADGVTA